MKTVMDLWYQVYVLEVLVQVFEEAFSKTELVDVYGHTTLPKPRHH